MSGAMSADGCEPASRRLLHWTACWRIDGRIAPNGDADLVAGAMAAIARGAQHGLEPMAWSDAPYPPALAAIVDPPPVLWMRGSRAALEPHAVAIVGSRAASPYALDVAERLAADLASRGFAIVSGLARGVDSAAHRGAVSAGGSTIARHGLRRRRRCIPPSTLRSRPPSRLAASS